MIIKPKDTCLVLDLDDTLYKEYDYQTSGLKYVEKQIFNLYGIDFNGELLKLRDKGVSDIFFDAANTLKLPSDIKEISIKIKNNDLTLPRVLKEAGLAASTSEALRLIKQGAVKIEGKKINDPKHKLSLNSSLLYQVGKRKFLKITIPK